MRLVSVGIILVGLLGACARRSDQKVLIHYYPFARSPYAPIPLVSPSNVPGTFSFSVGAGSVSVQKVIDDLAGLDKGTFNRGDIRLVIRFQNGDFVAVDSKGGVLDRGREGKLSAERVREVAAILEAMPENPYSRVIKD